MKHIAREWDQKSVQRLWICLIVFVTYVSMLLMLIAGTTPEQYDISVGAPAPTQIKATKDIQDTVTTEANRARAAAEVEPTYSSVDRSIAPQVLADLDKATSEMLAIHADPGVDHPDQLTDEEAAALNSASPVELTAEQWTVWLGISSATAQQLFTDARALVKQALDSTILEGQESASIKNIRTELNKNYVSSLAGIAVQVVQNTIRPNMLIDQEITDANRAKAMEDTQVVWVVKDQEIVAEGQLVTEAQYKMIEALGYLNDDTFDLRLTAGLALMVALVLMAVLFYLNQNLPEMLQDARQMLLLCLILVLTMGFCLAGRMLHNYAVPVALGLLLTALLIDTRLSLFVHLMLMLLTAPLLGSVNVLYAVMLSCICCPLVTQLLRHKALRTTTLLCGLIIAVLSFFCTLAVGFINSAETRAVVTNAAVSAATGITSAVIAMGLQALLEWAFNLATASRLIELSNPNQPLLRRLLIEASGTYHHSIIVANLAEAAASAIGANGLLARVGAYYHDIGKLKRPLYFKENQLGANPHDHTDPRVSAAILTAHTRDGVQLAQKARLPRQVVDIIQQHHGDTPVLFFYDKARKLYGDDVDIATFRYPGPRPLSREAAVVMLSDTIEAATRALPNPDPEKIDALIRKLVYGKLSDGQLDKSPLSFHDIDVICSAFSTVLTGVFHERIEYPDVKIPGKEGLTAEQLPLVPQPAPQAETPAAPAPSKPEAAKPEPAPAPAAPAREAAAPVREAPQPEAEKEAEAEAPAAEKHRIIDTGTPAPPVLMPQEAMEASENGDLT